MASLFLALITIVGFWINHFLNSVSVYLGGRKIRRHFDLFFLVLPKGGQEVIAISVGI